MITSRSVAAGSATVDAIGSVSGTCIMRKKSLEIHDDVISEDLPKLERKAGKL